MVLVPLTKQLLIYIYIYIYIYIFFFSTCCDICVLCLIFLGKMGSQRFFLLSPFSIQLEAEVTDMVCDHLWWVFGPKALCKIGFCLVVRNFHYRYYIVEKL